MILMSAVVDRDILPFPGDPARAGERPGGGRTGQATAEAPALPGNRWYAFWKRAADTVLAAVLLVLTAPLLLAVVILVKLTSRGPAIYAQTRLGYKGRHFRIYKVRSMYHDCERLTGPQWCTRGDPRITPLGRFLRASHLDELPQLWNVLKGDMSLIGPRPERPEIAATLARAIPHYSGRLLVRPGVSGLAQVQLPPDTDLASVRLKLAYDLYYVQHPGLGFDLRLMLATAVRLLGLPCPVWRALLGVPGGEAVERPYRSWLRLGECVRTAGWQAAEEAPAPDQSARAYDLDLSKMEEEELAVVAWECGYYPAATELALRYHGPRLGLA
jgi:lipopolysaccharide/colanic/teichoic acid biosynthesis glycosyltransferase